jgi:hypothetical protein
MTRVNNNNPGPIRGNPWQTKPEAENVYRKLLMGLALACSLTAACHRTKVEPSTTSAVPPPVKAPTYTPGPQPTEAELRAAVKRTYEDVVSIDTARPTPFAVGDFNGDNSEDVAVVVKPGKGKLPTLNSEYVNWILEDPRQSRSPEQKKDRVRPSIGGNDVLLAVIHGHARDGWRNAMARQTYLLKNAVGEGFEKQSPQQMSTGSNSLPVLKGDVIREKLDGTSGIIFWTGARYAWHPVS